MIISKELLVRYRQGDATPEEEELLYSCFMESEHTELTRFLDEEWEKIPMEETGDEEAKARVWQRLESDAYMDERKDRKLNKRGRYSGLFSRPAWVVGVAATVVLVVFAGLRLWLVPEVAPVSTFKQEVIKENMGSKPLRIELTEGSVVWLAAKSKLKYANPFMRDHRSIDLDGEAYFEISRDTSHPFKVNTKFLTVKVLGTSFTVNSFAEKEGARVSVHSGAVSVSVVGQKSGVVLLPNERVSFSGKMKLVKELVESPVIVESEMIPNQFEFTATPIPEVFKMLETAYQVHIKFDEKLLKKCSLSAKLSDQSLFTKLDMICASIGGSYLVEGTAILITAPGCDEN
jgi:transmembrane sensor